jgi:hypothetical protein
MIGFEPDLGSAVDASMKSTPRAIALRHTDMKT